MLEFQRLQGRWMVRLDRAAHAALLQLRSAHPDPVWADPMSAIFHAIFITDYGLAKIVTIPNPNIPAKNNPPHGPALLLTPRGEDVANILPPISPRGGKLAPPIPLADFLRIIPEDTLLKMNRPLIPEIEGGEWLVRLGVLARCASGEGWIVPRAVSEAMAEGAVTSDRHPGSVAPVQLALTQKQIQMLRTATTPAGLSASVVDGRAIRVLSNTSFSGMGLLALSNPGAAPRYTVNPRFRRFVEAILKDERSPVALFLLLPEALKKWFSSRLLFPAPDHARALTILGVVHQRGEGDWRMTRLGNILHPSLHDAYADQQDPNRFAVDLTDDLTGEIYMHDGPAPTGSGVTYVKNDEIDTDDIYVMHPRAETNPADTETGDEDEWDIL